MRDIDWSAISVRLDATGHAVLPALLTLDECAALRAMYPQTALFRSRIVMARHGFGRGEYQYFAYPLPPLLQQLRETLYAHLAPLANRWNRQLRVPVTYPGTLQAFLARCHAAMLQAK
jgi:hypothetical protein